MAEEVVTIAMQTVGDLLIGEINFLRSVSKQVEEVQTELKQMQSFLKDADSRQTKEESIRNLVKEIRSLAYRIENVLDTYAIEVASRKEGLGIQNAVKRFVRILCKGKSIHKVGLEIENIKTRLRIIKENFVTLGVTRQEEGQSSNAGEVGQRKTYAHEVEEYFVGMEKDITQLVSLVTDEERAHRVISIHGMGGLGKTTLARKIYNHVNVQRCYQGFAWVSISKQFKKETIFRSILKQLLKDEERKRKKGEEREQMDEQNGKKDLEKMDETELVTELYQVQKARKCLVVLDDLWEINDWKLLSAAFPFKEVNSKILMTTRTQALAKIEFAYELGHLSEDECWDLLRKKAFSKRSFPVSPEDAQVYPQFEKVGKEMIHKCEWLPLAISVLGGILSEKVSLHDWREVSLHVDAYLRSENSKDEYGAVSQVLALSYDSLPYHLKPCFLYLGHFREDEDIDVERLYQMWTAEGMILSAHRGKEETSMHAAEYYLSEMAQRSMVQVKVNDLSITKRLKSCRLHDLVRDFCLVYGSRVEFLQVLDSGGTSGTLLDSSTDNPCRYSIHHLDDDAAIPELYKALEPNEHLRSLLLYSARNVTFPQTICHLKSFKFLRVLNIFGYYFTRGKLPKAFKMLIHLRFLRLRECYLKKVQAWIGNFPNLQTLELSRPFYGSIKVPNVLWKLKQLRHLYLPYVVSRLRVYGLSKLETLANFSCNEENLSDLSDLINLRRLHVHVDVSRGRTLPRILNHLNSNQHKLDEVRVDVFEGTLTQDILACLNLHHLRLSRSLCNFHDLELSIPSNLIELEFTNCRFEGDPMEALGKLSSLRSLTIDGGNLKFQKMICHPKSFPELRYLTIGWFLELWYLEVLEGAMPKLSYISIDTCPYLEMIPEGLRFIAGIKELRMEMPKEFNDRVRVIDGEEGVDFHKISHIPLVSLTDYDERRFQVIRRAIEEDSGPEAPATSINQAACFRGIL